MDDRVTTTILGAGATVGLMFGALLLIAASRLFGVFGLESSPTAILLGHVLGAEMVGFNGATALALRDRRARASHVRGHIIADAIAGVLSLIAVIGGTGNALAWLVPILFLGFAVGLAYALLRPPSL